MSKDLFTELMDKLREMERETELMKASGRQLAIAERDYRIALAKKTVELRTGGMPATLTPDLARGEKAVADLRMQRDLAKTDWEVSRQRLFVLSQDCKIIDAQLSREWRAS